MEEVDPMQLTKVESAELEEFVDKGIIKEVKPAEIASPSRNLIVVGCSCAIHGHRAIQLHLERSQVEKQKPEIAYISLPGGVLNLPTDSPLYHRNRRRKAVASRDGLIYQSVEKALSRKGNRRGELQLWMYLPCLAIKGHGMTIQQSIDCLVKGTLMLKTRRKGLTTTLIVHSRHPDAEKLYRVFPGVWWRH